MQIDGLVALASVIAGFTVGLTGMGGGALMTPILVLLFKVQPLAAVSSDLVAAMVMKPVGGSVHIRRRTVSWELVRWLMVGSVPTAFAGVFVLRLFGNGEQLQNRLKIALGVVLLIAVVAMVVKGWLQGRQTARDRSAGTGGRSDDGPVQVRKLPTILTGAVGGLMVGMTSVGSGSVIIILLILLYPSLRGARLVGTDLVQAIPLVASAAIAHIFFGDLQIGLTSSVLLGSIPGVYLGARLSSRAPDGVIRPALVFVLLASALKLLNMGTVQLVIMLGVIALVGLPVWGAIDARGRPQHHWDMAGLTKRVWVRLQAAGALFGFGFAAAVAYFASARPRLEAVAVPSEGSAPSRELAFALGLSDAPGIEEPGEPSRRRPI